MRKVIFFMAQAMIGGIIVLWLINHPGTLDIHWLEYHLHMSIALCLGGFFAILLVGVFLFRVSRAIWRIPGKLYERYRLYDRKRACESLLTSLSAYQNENSPYASKALHPALQDPETRPIAIFLAALIAQKQEKPSEAQARFADLTKLPGGEALGYGGLIALERMSGEAHAHDGADYARQALPYITHAPKLAVEIFDTFLSCELLDEAAQALQKTGRLKLLTKEQRKLLESRLATARSQTAIRSNEFGYALEEAEKAYQSHPYLQETLIYADLLISQHYPKQAQKLLEKAWRQMPDPKIINLYLRTHESLDPLAKYQLVEKLTRDNPFHPESLSARVHMALEAQLWGIARSHLQEYQEHHPEDTRFPKLMAEYEQQANHDANAALKWLYKK